MANILVTGSNGQLGSEIKEMSKAYSFHHFFFTDTDTLDITNLVELKKFFNNNTVQYIINAAAYTAVDKAEKEKKEAEKVNVHAVTNLAKLAANYKIKLFHISTDYVFDGNAHVPYDETSEVNPQSVYGLTKLRGESEAMRHIQTMIIRTSWLYSRFGNNFVKTILRLGGENSELNIVYDQVGTPTNAMDLAKVILEIITKSEEKPDYFKPGLYHYANEGVCSWYDFACEIVRQADLNVTVKAIETKDYPTPAMRPHYSVLNKNKIKETYGLVIPYWIDSLTYCISELKNK